MCLPSACFLLVLAYGVIYVKWARNLNLKVPVDVVTVQLEALGGVTFDEKIVAVVQALQIALWMSRKESVPGTSGWSEEEDSPWKGNPGFWGDGGVALMCAFTLFLIPSRSRPGESVLTYEMTKHLPWDIIAMSKLNMLHDNINFPLIVACIASCCDCSGLWLCHRRVCEGIWYCAVACRSSRKLGKNLTHYTLFNVSLFDCYISDGDCQ